MGDFLLVRPLAGAPIKNNRVQRLFRLHPPANAGNERRLPGPQVCVITPFAVCIVGKGIHSSGASRTPPPTTKKASPWGKLSPKVTDEGRRYRSRPFMGNNGSPAPHPAFGHLPPRGKASSLAETVNLRQLLGGKLRVLHRLDVIQNLLRLGRTDQNGRDLLVA